MRRLHRTRKQVQIEQDLQKLNTQVKYSFGEQHMVHEYQTSLNKTVDFDLLLCSIS